MDLSSFAIDFYFRHVCYKARSAGHLSPMLVPAVATYRLAVRTSFCGNLREDQLLGRPIAIAKRTCYEPDICFQAAQRFGCHGRKLLPDLCARLDSRLPRYMSDARGRTAAVPGTGVCSCNKETNALQRQL